MHVLAAHTHWTFATRVGCARTGESLGALHGHATAKRTPSGGIDVIEQGVWEANASGTRSPGMPPAGTRATNRWRAIPMDRGWRIEHLRLGEPVTLVELEPVVSSAILASEHECWQSSAPHRCGADVYELTATIANETAPTVALQWVVRGPSKAQRLQTVYRPLQPAR